MGEITKLTLAKTASTSLRTTVPISIVRQFRLGDGDKLEWTLDIKDGKMIIVVSPLTSKKQ
jgi:bifunctional DNA-binding transcriptional regulator/antitoxin component of YhaV-PrlF toxin-antitoxin module